jgi:hypothetical protein
MTERKDTNISDLEIKEIQAEIFREKSLRTGHISAFHVWWARRPNVLARVAVYLAITEEKNPQADFLRALGVVNPSEATLVEARSGVRDASWRWCVREHLLNPATSIDSISPSVPRVLDPFAGGGSIPMEAARLGCDAYAGDLNPLAFRILRATIEYPATLTLPTDTFSGTGPNGRWDGLGKELRCWAKKVEQHASERLTDLFPPDPSTGDPLDRYFWFVFARCTSSGCGTFYPLQPSLRIADGPTPISISFAWSDHGPVPRIVYGSARPQARRTFDCPACGCQHDAGSIAPENLSLRLCLARRTLPVTFLEVAAESQASFAPWSNETEAQLRRFLDLPQSQPLHVDLPAAYRNLKRRGANTFENLFSPRQLLVAAQYVDSISAVVDQMSASAMDRQRTEALSTYLSLFLGYLVSRNCRLCAWNAERADARPAFERATPALPNVFVERSPHGMMESWLASVIPAIEAASAVPAAARVFQSSATELPFPSDFFDAVVTDPPYYDAVPYADLSDFFWAWEGMINPGAAAVPTQHGHTEVLERLAIQDPETSYREGMCRAFEEVWRVLKPGRKFCLIFSGKATERFQDYVDLCQKAGLELLDIKLVPEQTIAAAGTPGVVTYLIYLRKPTREPAREPLQTTDAASLLDAATMGRSVRYAGLAELMANRISSADLADILPLGGKGAIVEQLMEVLADSDPREVLVRCFGIRGLREIANELSGNSSAELPTSTIEAILTHFGFSLPPMAHIDGAPQVRQRIRKMTSKIMQALQKEEMRGPFLEACTAIERLLRLSIWGWAQLTFGANRDAQLLAILRETQTDRRYDLNRLAMGDILVLLRKLPAAMATSPAGQLLEQKLGRAHVYSAKTTKFVEVLERLIATRNRVEHDKSGYWTDIDPGSARSDLAAVLADTERLLGALVDAKAIPVVVEPIKEVRDKWNRKAYVLALDDGTEKEAYFSSALQLGDCYLYFGTETNPKPVDPLLLPIEEVGEIA